MANLRRSLGRKRTGVIGSTPKTEIKMAGLHPSVGHKRFEKISPDRCGYGCDFSKPFLRQ
jgi:hypothetical protein